MLDENEWDSGAEVTVPALEESAHPAAGKHSLRGWYSTGILILLALVVGIRLWQQAHSGLAAVERGLSHTLALETEASSMGDEVLAGALLDPQMDDDWRESILAEMGVVGERAAAEIEITDYSLSGDRAMVEVRVTDAESGTVYREHRFYQESADGWLRSQPVPELWGDARTLESENFVFHYRQRDGAAVAEAAALLDKAYLHMHSALGLSLLAAPAAEAKVQVYVAVGGEAIGDIWYEVNGPLWVNSPRLLRLSDRLTDGTALAETIAFPLRRALVNSTLSKAAQRYQPTADFSSGLRLWLAWEETTLPIDSKSELINWLYGNALYGPPGLRISYPEVCELFGAWQVVSPTVPMGFYCTEDTPFSFATYFRASITLRDLPLTISWEGLPHEKKVYPLTGALLLSNQGQTMAVASVLEYTIHTYGQTSIAALLQAAREGKSWHTIAPEVFGVSEADYETGWWAWLAAEYGVDTSEFQAGNHFDKQHLAFPPMPDAVIHSARPSDVRAAGR